MGGTIPVRSAERDSARHDDALGGGAGLPGEGPGTPVGGTQPNTFKLPVNHTLIRFLDTDLEPGVSYQYRVAVKVRNPNYGKQDKVAKKDLSNQEVVTSPFFQVKQTLNVPAAKATAYS